MRDNINETLDMLEKQENAEELLEVVNSIVNLLGTNVEQRFKGASYRREWKLDLLKISIVQG